jgi:hypothetical protein
MRSLRGISESAVIASKVDHGMLSTVINRSQTVLGFASGMYAGYSHRSPASIAIQSSVRIYGFATEILINGYTIATKKHRGLQGVALARIGIASLILTSSTKINPLALFTLGMIFWGLEHHWSDVRHQI